MKKDIHPNYRPVVFQDSSAGFSVLVGSTIKTDETIKLEDGKEYPLYRVEVSSASHPFFTGKQHLVDTERTIEKFEARIKIAEEKQKEQEEINKRRAEKAVERKSKKDEKLAKELGISDIANILGGSQAPVKSIKPVKKTPVKQDSAKNDDDADNISMDDDSKKDDKKN